MELDVNKILDIYKQRVADLEYELIVQVALNEQLKELLDSKKSDNEK